MKLQATTVKELRHIAIGVLCGSAIMVAIFALMGRFSWPVVFGALLGCAIAIGNFLYLGLSVQKAAGDSDRAKFIMKSSYTVRMLLTMGALVVGFASSWFHWVAVLIPLLLPRVTIYGMQLLGMYQPAKPSAELQDKGE